MLIFKCPADFNDGRIEFPTRIDEAMQNLRKAAYYQKGLRDGGWKGAKL